MSLIKITIRFVSGILFTSILFTSLIGREAQARKAPVVRIDGSSTVFPITEAMAEEFQTSLRGKVRVTVGISGTGGGFKKFCRGEIDVQNASRPISESELKKCAEKKIQFIEIPVAFDATAIVVHKENKWLEDVSIAELKKMWEPAAQGKVMLWSDVRPSWPKKPLKLYGAGADSGTFDYFTEVVTGKSKSSRGDYTASEDDNMLVVGVSRDLYSMGYLPLAYVEENLDKLKILKVNGVMPSLETVKDGTYAPLSRPVFIYARDTSLDKTEVYKFVDFYIKNAHLYVPEVKYVPLSTEAYRKLETKLKSRKYGTAFGGHNSVGLKIDELVR